MIKLLFLCGRVACGIVLSIVLSGEIQKSRTSKNEPWQLSFHFPVDTSPLLLNSTVSVSVCLCVNFDCKYLFYISTLAGPRPGADMQKIADIRIGCRAAAADKASTQLWQCQQPCNEWRKKIFLSPTHGEIIYGGTRWIEEDCSTTFSEYIFLFPACLMISHWLTKNAELNSVI